MNNLLVSFIIPVYNVKPYLEACIESVLAQKGCGIECICVDDGSSDGSAELLDRLAKRDTRVAVIHQKNAGVGAARNAGIDRARGRYLSFVDSDDILEPEFLTCALRAFDRYPDLDVWIGQLLWVTADNVTMEGQGVKTTILDTTDPLNDFLYAKGRVYYYTVYPKLFRADLVRQPMYRFPIGTRAGEDMAFMAKVYSGARRVVVADQFVYRYRVLKSGLLHIASVKLVPDRLSSFKDLLAFAQASGRLLKMKGQIGFAALGTLRGMIRWGTSWVGAREYVHAYCRQPDFRRIVIGSIARYAPLKYRFCGLCLICLPRFVMEGLFMVGWKLRHLKRR